MEKVSDDWKKGACIKTFDGQPVFAMKNPF